MKKFENMKKIASELKEIIKDWENKKAPLIEARDKLVKAENELQNSFDMDTVKNKNKVVAEVGYTLSDVDEALKRWHRARFEAVRDYNISGKLAAAIRLDRAANEDKSADLERLETLRDEFIAKMQPLVKELSDNREAVLEDIEKDFDYIMQVRQELTPTDTVVITPFDNFKDYLVLELVNEVLNMGILNKGIYAHSRALPINGNLRSSFR